MSLAILTPVLGRPHRVRPFVDAVIASTPQAHVVFIADPDDTAELDAINEVRESVEVKITVLTSTHGYAGKIRLAVLSTDEDLLFFAADDLEPCPGWFEAASQHIGEFDVVGINDLLPRRREHATHFLCTREYALQPCIDGSPGPLYSGYDHSFCDDEFIATAKLRGAYTYEPEAKTLHLHPQGRTAPDDATYQAGRRRYAQDQRMFRARVAQWM